MILSRAAYQRGGAHSRYKQPSLDRVVSALSVLCVLGGERVIKEAEVQMLRSLETRKKTKPKTIKTDKLETPKNLLSSWGNCYALLYPIVMR